MPGGGLVPKLPRDAWLVLGGDALSAVGTGMSLPFLVVYLHHVRGIPVGVASAALSVLALAGFVGNPLGGWLADRIGSRAAVMIGLATAAVGTSGFALVHTTWQAFPPAAVAGLGIAIVWPAEAALLALVVAPAQRPSVFSVRHGTMNAGLAVGGLLAALVVRGGSPAQFVTLYLIDAATFLAFIPVLLALGGLGRPSATGAAASAGSWREVVRDRAFRRVWVLTALVIAAGYAQFNASFPVFATRPGGIEPGLIGLVFAANTLAVVGLQLVTLRIVGGWRRTTCFALTCGCWSVAWLVALAAGAAGGGGRAVALFVAVAVVFAVGETFLSPSLGPIVNDLASDELRGRYNGFYTLAWTSGFAVGPAFGGLLLGAGEQTELFGGLAALCVLLGLAGVRLARHLPDAVNRIERHAAPEAEGAVTALVGGSG